jgi:hypothetical protein
MTDSHLPPQQQEVAAIREEMNTWFLGPKSENHARKRLTDGEREALKRDLAREKATRILREVMSQASGA